VRGEGGEGEGLGWWGGGQRLEVQVWGGGTWDYTGHTLYEARNECPLPD
jgi:hypothetical protein